MTCVKLLTISVRSCKSPLIYFSLTLAVINSFLVDKFKLRSQRSIRSSTNRPVLLTNKRSEERRGNCRKYLRICFSRRIRENVKLIGKRIRCNRSLKLHWQRVEYERTSSKHRIDVPVNHRNNFIGI